MSKTLAYLTKEKIAGTNVKNKLENASFAAQAPAAEKDTSLLTSVVAVYPMVAKIDTAVPNMRLRVSHFPLSTPAWYCLLLSSPPFIHSLTDHIRKRRTFA